MNLKAIFLPGQTELTVNGLHQWDYGQMLEIHADDLPTLVEVHFACPGMKDAVVRTCAVVDGVASAAIPDQCLEQTSPITAWLYEIGETSGTTTRTITLSIIGRARPQPSESVPQEYSDKYTEVLAAVNAEIEELKKGNVTVAKAIQADQATNAANARNADYALDAGAAELALAVLINGNAPFGEPTKAVTSLPSAGYYCIQAEHAETGLLSSVVTYWDGVSNTFAGLLRALYATTGDHEGDARGDYLYIGANGGLVVESTTQYGGGMQATQDYTFYIVKLWG